MVRYDEKCESSFCVTVQEVQEVSNLVEILRLR